MSPRKIAIGIVVLLGVGGGWWMLRPSGEEASPAAAQGGGGGGFSVPVETATVTASTLEETVQTVGSLVADQGIVLRPELAGVVSAILFTDGQTVKAGQPLLQLEDSVYKAQLAQAEAQLSLAKRTDTRASNLAGRGAGTVQAADEAASQLEAATAAVQLARATLAKTVITAPFDGIAGIRQVSLGDYVSPGQDLVTLQAQDPMKVDFRVSESLLAKVAVGQQVSLAVTAYPDRAFTGEVSAIDPLVDAAGRSLSLRAKIPNPDGALRAGLFATVTLRIGEKPGAVMVPATAITPMGGQQFVFKVVDGKATLTPVTIGVRQPERVEILGGVAVGDTLVTGGQVKLMMMGGAQAPMGVTVIPPTTEQAAP